MAVKQEITLFGELIESIVHTIEIDSIANDVPNATSVISTGNTLYLNIGKKITIDSIQYRITDFSLNESITVQPVTSGDNLPDENLTEFTIPTPNYYHGTPKKVSSENKGDQKQPGYQGPMIWLLEWVDILGPEDKFESVVRSTISGARLFFLDTCKHQDWNVDDHYERVIDVMENELNFIFRSLQLRMDIVDEINVPDRRNHADFGAYVNNKGYDKTLLPGRLSGVEAIVDIPFVVDPCDNETPIDICGKVELLVNSESYGETDAGLTKTLSIIDQDENPVTVTKIDDNTGQVNTGGDPVTTDFNGTPTVEDTPAGGNLDINVQYENGSPIGTLITDDPNEKLIEIPDPVTLIETAPAWKPGQTTSYFPGDGADTNRGIGADFFTLSENNVFGNLNRFTDELGTQVYAKNIVLNHKTRNNSSNNIQGWYRLPQTPGLNLAVIMAGTYTFEGFTWFVPQIDELTGLHNSQAHIDNGFPFDYSPLNVASTFLWMNEIGGVANAYYYYAPNGTTNRVTYTNTGISVLFTRIFTPAELGI